jgi:hypothetical protein
VGWTPTQNKLDKTGDFVVNKERNNYERTHTPHGDAIAELEHEAWDGIEDLNERDARMAEDEEQQWQVNQLELVAAIFGVGSFEWNRLCDLYRGDCLRYHEKANTTP